jgi:ABC-type siderophore export system fused ATPase/permease subunit
VKLPPLLVYSVLRLLAFLVPLGILWFFFPIFREFWWLAALFAALIGISISLLFLRNPLSDASRAIYAKRSSKVASAPSDEDIEDAGAPAAEGTDQSGPDVNGPDANGSGDAGSRHAA